MEHIALGDMTMPKFIPEMTKNIEFRFIHLQARENTRFSLLPLFNMQNLGL